jgi:uncharacterized membrane protein
LGDLNYSLVFSLCGSALINLIWRTNLSVFYCFVFFLDFSYAQSFDTTAYLKKYNERIKMSRIDDIYIPKNTEDAMKELLRLTDPDGRTKILSVPEDSIAQ